MTFEIKHTRAIGPDGSWVLTPAYFRDGEAITEAEYHAALPDREPAASTFYGQHAGSWPMKSVALGVDPSQVAEANARNKARGVGVSYDPATGRAIIPTAAEYKKLQRVESEVMGRDIRNKQDFY